MTKRVKMATFSLIAIIMLAILSPEVGTETVDAASPFHCNSWSIVPAANVGSKNSASLISPVLRGILNYEFVSQ